MSSTIFYCFVIVVAAFVLTLICYPLYFNFGWFKWFYHKILGWCTPDDSPQWSDGCSQHARCKHCGREIMMDSQGNWF